MNTTNWIQSLGAVALAVAGVLASRGAFAQNGSCGTTEQPRVQCQVFGPLIDWGGECIINGKNTVTTSTYGGTKVMIVNRGDNSIYCIEGAGVSILGDVTYCANHDNTADGSSVSDGTGDCNNAVKWTGSVY